MQTPKISNDFSTLMSVSALVGVFGSVSYFHNKLTTIEKDLDDIKEHLSKLIEDYSEKTGTIKYISDAVDSLDKKVSETEKQLHEVSKYPLPKYSQGDDPENSELKNSNSKTTVNNKRLPKYVRLTKPSNVRDNQDAAKLGDLMESLANKCVYSSYGINTSQPYTHVYNKNHKSDHENNSSPNNKSMDYKSGNFRSMSNKSVNNTPLNNKSVNNKSVNNKFVNNKTGNNKSVNNKADCTKVVPEKKPMKFTVNNKQKSCTNINSKPTTPKGKKSGDIQTDPPKRKFLSIKDKRSAMKNTLGSKLNKNIKIIDTDDYQHSPVPQINNSRNKQEEDLDEDWDENDDGDLDDDINAFRQNSQFLD